MGEPAMAIENPDGELEVDRRDPVFYVPEWVTPPAWLVPHLEERRNNEAPADRPSLSRPPVGRPRRLPPG